MTTPTTPARVEGTLDPMLGCCAACAHWIAEMHNDDPLRPSCFGHCEGDGSPFDTGRTHGSTTCPRFTPNEKAEGLR